MDQSSLFIISKNRRERVFYNQLLPTKGSFLYVCVRATERALKREEKGVLLFWRRRQTLNFAQARNDQGRKSSVDLLCPQTIKREESGNILHKAKNHV